MTAKVILHIPHASNYIPSLEGYEVKEDVLNNEILKLTDWHTDDLFYRADDEVIKAPFSRVFCDVERFEDDEKEIMAQFGMGVIYEKSDDGKQIRTINPSLRNKILSSYYKPHHQKLANAVNTQLRLHGKALIIDSHSFPNRPFKRDLNQNTTRPDFNIGTDRFHTPKSLINESITFFERAGYSLGIDWPYTGTIVPMEHYQTNANISSIMLEINRSLYLNNATNQKSARYQEIKKVVQDYIKVIKKSFFKEERRT